MFRFNRRSGVTLVTCAVFLAQFFAAKRAQNQNVADVGRLREAVNKAHEFQVNRQYDRSIEQIKLVLRLASQVLGSDHRNMGIILNHILYLHTYVDVFGR
jgi:hypothetical protein